MEALWNPFLGPMGYKINRAILKNDDDQDGQKFDSNGLGYL